MTTSRHRTIKLSSSPSSATEGSSGRAGPRRAGALAAALAVLMLSGVPAVAQPTFIHPGTLTVPVQVVVGVAVEDMFDNAGTNPRFTDATFSTMDYYDSSLTGIDSGSLRVFVLTKTNAELNALPSPPPNPFEVDVTFTMTNDEGDRAQGTITIGTHYAKAATPALTPPPTKKPTPIALVQQNASPGILVSTLAKDLFSNAGTNPRIIDVTFDTMEYYDSSATGVSHGRVWVKTKTSADLRALPSPPPNPFTVEAIVEMTNDEGQMALGGLKYKTTYDTRTATAAPAPAQPAEEPPPAYAGADQLILENAGSKFNTTVNSFFKNVGTNERFTEVAFSNPEYISAGNYISGNVLSFSVKASAELNALPSPPPNPFTFTATVTMTNDEDETATGTLRFKSNYRKDTGEDATPPPAPIKMTAAPGAKFGFDGESLFGGSHFEAKLVSVELSTRKYYEYIRMRSLPWPMFTARVKTDEQLAALSPPPPSPFTVTAKAKGVIIKDPVEVTVEITTTYVGAPEPSEESSEESQPVVSKPGEFRTVAGGTYAIGLGDLFSNTGTNPRFTGMTHEPKEYLDSRTGFNSSNSVLLWYVKTVKELDGLATPPPDKFSIDTTVNMTNDEGQTATSKATLHVTIFRDR